MKSKTIVDASMSNSVLMTYITLAVALEGTAFSLFVAVFVVLQLTNFDVS